MYNRERPPDDPEVQAHIMKQRVYKPICPLRNTPCAGELCAWWYSKQEKCAVLDISMSLDILQDRDFYKGDDY